MLAIPSYLARGYPRSGLETGDQQQQTSAAVTADGIWPDLGGGGNMSYGGNKNHAKVDWNAWQLKKNENLSSIDIYHLPITLEASHMIKTIKID